MTQEEKAKRYDEAIKAAKEWYNDPHITIGLKGNLEDIFPELKEPADEKIRKMLIKFFSKGAENNSSTNGISDKDIVAWLEKQEMSYTKKDVDDAYLKGIGDTKNELEKQGGVTKLSEEEQNRFAKGVLTSCALSFINYLDAHKYEGKMCVSNGECEDIENAFHNAMWDRLHGYYCKYIEKQGGQILANSAKTCKDEQKPTDSVESRYSIGDVLCDKSCTTLSKDAQPNFEIVDIRNGMYICDKGSFPISQQDEYELVAKKIEQKPDDKVEPKFHEGDIIKPKDGSHEPWQIMQVDILDKKYRFADGYVIHFSHEDDYEIVEQKPANNIEPKFKVGDWITNGEYTWKVTDIKSLDYILQSQDGHIVDDTISYVDYNFRLWTIKDAKGGDTLVDIYNNIGIFQKCKGIYWQSYLYLGCNGELLGFSDGGYHKQTKTHPATKEQRDTLMKAMADAGWEFDFEKKELKKIGQKPAEWSEEDKCILLSIKCVIDNVWHSTSDIDTGYSIEELKEMWEWLDEIWQRVKYHTEWSEEDERICQCLIEDQEESLDKVSNDKHGHSEIISDLTEMYDERIDWLKSLRHLKQWKPSDEQIEAIRLARSFVTDDFGEHQTLSEILMELEEQLKALKKLK